MISKIQSDYFYGQQANQFSFYRIPKIMFSDRRYSGLSTEAKVLYGILLDRMELSARNRWLDEKGRVYIIFTIEEVMVHLGCANKKAGALLAELEKKAGLIERKRQGLGKPNLIYVKNFIFPDGHIQKCESNISRNVVPTIPEVSESHGNHTDNNQTDYSDTVKNGSFTTDAYACGTGYSLKEITAPAGYQLSTQTYNLDGYSASGKCTGPLTTSQVTVKENVITGYFQILKRTKDPVSGETEPENGANFRYYLKKYGTYTKCLNDYRGLLTTDANGRATSKELPYGTYVVEQRSGAAGTEFVPSFEVTISQNGKTYEFTKDNPYWTGTLSIVKYEAGSKTPLIAKFNLLDQNKTVLETGSTGTDGKLSFKTKLVYGRSYYVQETETPDGYALDETLHSVSVTQKDQAISLTLENELEVGSIFCALAATATMPEWSLPQSSPNRNPPTSLSIS